MQGVNETFVTKLTELPYLAALEPEVKQAIAAKLIVCRWRENRQVYDAGDWPGQACIVWDGIVETKPARNAPASYVSHGAVLGDHALLSCMPYLGCSAIARTPCTVIILGEWYRVLAHKEPTVLCNVLQEEQRRNAAREEYLAGLLRASKPGRVLFELLAIAQAVATCAGNGTDGFPFEISWYKNLSDIGRPLSVCRPKTREALEMAGCIGAIVRPDRHQIDLPPILLPGCVEKLKLLLDTRLSDGNETPPSGSVSRRGSGGDTHSTAV